MEVGILGYSVSAIAYLLFTLLLIISWRGASKGGSLTACVFLSAIWSGYSVTIAALSAGPSFLYYLLETSRYALWFIFLFKLFEYDQTPLKALHPRLHKFRTLTISYTIIAAILLSYNIGNLYTHLFLLFLPITGLVLIEQLTRNIPESRRWAGKYLFVGIGAVFAFDFFLYSNAIMFSGLNINLWETRGYVNAFSIPLIAISVSRSKEWSLDLFVSRQIVLYSTTILGGGLYLVLMSISGFYIKKFGGNWGDIFQITFLSLSGLLLILIVFSSQLRAKLNVFISKHFYKNRYDYRHEWLRLTSTLAKNPEENDRYTSSIKALANIVDCRSGHLWLNAVDDDYKNVSAWNTHRVDSNETEHSSLIKFLKDTCYIIDILDLRNGSKDYIALSAPTWLEKCSNPWLIIPLLGKNDLIGFFVLMDPLTHKKINWEDRDILKTAAKQIANHIESILSSDALGEAKQFEAFNRLSAFMVHDLKNISSELNLVSKNSLKYRDDPDFLNDAFDTVTNASNDINKVVTQLKRRHILPGAKSVVNLSDVIHNVIDKSKKNPPISSQATAIEHMVECDSEKLAIVLKHLIDNAQDATAEGGKVRVSLSRNLFNHVVTITDNGIGMSQEFIQDRLFKAFDTTKGNAGMGIGMYESRDFIRNIGGDITVSSKVNIGTTVTVAIPAYQYQKAND